MLILHLIKSTAGRKVRIRPKKYQKDSSSSNGNVVAFPNGEIPDGIHFFEDRLISRSKFQNEAENFHYNDIKKK